ncbi:OpgC domain-containing protein [Leptolyngbya sp. 15MV]|nr:OpgC domain-containing protein [Leptolyngbya sp. 15MV]
MDFFRGLALWMIFVNHTPGNVLGHFTLRKVSLGDATEAFVLLAGYAAGIAYGRLLEREGWLHAGARVAQRIGTLYVAHIFLFVVFTAQVGFSAAALDQAAYLDELALDPFSQEPYRALLEALLLRYQPAFLDVLPLYIVVLGLFAVTMPLMRWPPAMLGASVTLYVATRTLGLELPSWTGDSWFFNPFAWQLLFVIGIWLGRADPATLARRFPFSWWVAVPLLAAMVVNAFAINLFWRGALFGIEAPEWLYDFYAGVDKAGLHPARLINMLLLVWLAAHLVPVGARWLNGRLAGLFVLMGQHGLPVFCLGIFLSFLGRVAIEISTGWTMQVVVNAVGLAALIGIGALSAWYDAGGKRKAPALPTSPNMAKVS